MKKTRMGLLGFVMLVAAAICSGGQLEVGVATVDITPEVGVDRMRSMSGVSTLVENVHDPLTAKAIVFKNGEQSVALVSMELIGFSPVNQVRIRKEVAAKTGITNVITSVTHTHGSGSPEEAISEKIIERAVNAVVEANNGSEPVSIGYGAGVLNGGYNRRVINADGTVDMLWNNSDRKKTAPVDDEIGVILIQRVSDGSTLATLVNYAVHPVISMNFDELIVSADYPGAMARKLEARLGGTCIFYMGASGDINPYDADMFRFATAEQTFTAIDQLAEALAVEIETVANGIETSHSDVTLDFDSYYLNMADRKNGPHGDKERSVEVDTFLIDKRFAFVSIPGEIFVELGLDLKERSPAEATFLLACANDYFRYIPTIKAAGEGGYGATSGTQLEVGAGELMIHQAIVSLKHQMNEVKPLEPRP